MRTGLHSRFAGHFTGDFDQMLDRRLIRMIVPYSRTLFFQDKGTIHGTAAAGAHLLEGWINKTFKLGARLLTVTLTPVSRDKLFDTLLAGAGDIAAGDITITEVRRKRVAFTTPVLRNVREIVATGADVPEFDTVEALAGKEIAVGRSTSYHESLTKLNERLAREGKPPVTITLVPDTLEPEDLMEMTAAGLLPSTVADDWVAGLWVQIIKGLKLHPKAALREHAKIAWAVRPNSPKLLETLNRAITEVGGTPNQWSNRTTSYLARLKQLHTATRGADLQRFRDTVVIFRRYAGKYQFDALLLVAQGYQESRLDQNARSRRGAVGLMQLMPRTGRGSRRRRHPQARTQRARGSQVYGPLDGRLFQGCPIRRAEPYLVCFCRLQCWARQNPVVATPGGSAGAQSKCVVRQRREGGGGAGRSGTGALRAQHL